MMKKRLLTMLIVVCIFSFSQSVLADETTPSGTYSVTPILSKNQTNDVEGFFDIKWQPGKEEQIGVRISNKTNEEKSYNILVTKAETNVNQIIDYSNNNDSELPTKFKIKKQVSFPQTVNLKANESKVIEGMVAFSSDDFNGILMGGINISENTDNTQKNSGISNVVVYNIPIVLRGNIDERPVPIIEFGKLNLEESLTNTMVLNVPIRNLGPNLLNKVSFDSKVFNKNKEMVEKRNVVFDVTPETIFDYQIPLSEEYKPGEYTLNLVMTHKNAGTWEFNQSFTVTDKDSKKINVVKKEKRNSWMIIVSLIILALLLTIFWQLSKKQKRREDL